MPKGKSKKSTPAELDKYFQRGIIDEDHYRDFWQRWWRSDKREQEDIIEQLTETLDFLGGQSEPKETRFHITKDKKLAQRQARRIGGYVVRRNNLGRFSKRGRHYQAIKNRKKGKK